MVLNLKKSCDNGTGRTAEWNDLKFEYTENWCWLVFGRNPVQTDRMVAI